MSNLNALLGKNLWVGKMKGGNGVHLVYAALESLREHSKWINGAAWASSTALAKALTVFRAAFSEQRPPQMLAINSTVKPVQSVARHSCTYLDDSGIIKAVRNHIGQHSHARPPVKRLAAKEIMVKAMFLATDPVDLKHRKGWNLDQFSRHMLRFNADHTIYASSLQLPTFKRVEPPIIIPNHPVLFNICLTANTSTQDTVLPDPVVPETTQVKKRKRGGSSADGPAKNRAKKLTGTVVNREAKRNVEAKHRTVDHLKELG
ncbi:hypothetical protein C8R44DRAFT_750526 [Mycena epipterygia]|nr:hypothetical protein C8R44DRAFT_750526 [Mycena epipterygia]